MADGTSTLGALLWGTSTGGAASAGESTLTLGVDRVDTRTPPDNTHIWGLQINQVKNLGLAISATFKGGTRLGILTQSASPFGATEQGLWCDTAGNPRWSFGGVANTLVAPALASKGDLVTYTGSAVTVLSGSGVANASVLVFDSTQAGGIKWTTHLVGAGSTPGIAVGVAAQLGTSPSAAIAGTDSFHAVTITTGTTPSAFVANTAVTVATITFATAYAAAPTVVMVDEANQAAAAIKTGASGVNFYAEQSTISTTQWLVKAVSSGTPTLAASTAYKLFVSVGG